MDDEVKAALLDVPWLRDPDAEAIVAALDVRGYAITPKLIVTTSLHDGVVTACSPPKSAVLVTLTSEHRRTGVYEVPIDQTTSLGREDIIARRGGRLLLIRGPEGDEPSPSWHLIDETDQVLATVWMPPNTSTVLQAFVVDRRVFDGRRRPPGATDEIIN